LELPEADADTDALPEGACGERDGAERDGATGATGDSEGADGAETDPAERETDPDGATGERDGADPAERDTDADPDPGITGDFGELGSGSGAAASSS